MNTKGAVLGLVVVVSWLGLVNVDGKKGKECKLFCPEGQKLNKYACKCEPVVVAPTGECPLLKCLVTEPPCVVYKTNPTTGCRTCECSSFCPSDSIVLKTATKKGKAVKDKHKVKGQDGQQPCNLVCPEGKVLDITICKCVPKPECPLRKCRGLSPPCLSYLRDDNGCRTCECIYRCPVRNCSTNNCAYGVEFFDDRFGCKSCRCKQPDTCNPSKCRLYCAKGYEKDIYGFDKCKCKLCGDLCKIGCKYGKLVDFDGCQVCDCKPKPKCGPVCSNATCENGRVLDEQGCPTCQCVKRCPCGPVCLNLCTYQRVYDKYGCPTCTCLPPP